MKDLSLSRRSSAHRFAALDGWRGICALSVVLFHLNADTHVRALTRNAWVAVDFFFVLSGFVLMSGFGGRVSDLGALRRFAGRRLARLYPLHLAMLLVFVAWIGFDAWRNGEPLFAGTHGLSALIQCLVLIQGFTSDALSWNFPSWSISIELWASLFFGVILWRAGRHAWIVFGLAALVLAALVLGFGEPAGPATTETGAVLKAAHYLLAFCAGAALFELYGHGTKQGRSFPGWIEWPALALVLAIFLFADRIASPLSIGLFAIVILIFARERGPISAWLKRASPQAAGRWSYSIYLVHPLWTLAVFWLVSTSGDWLGRSAVSSDSRLVLGGPFAMDLVAAACLAAVIATAALAWRFIERPGMKLAARPPTPSPAAKVQRAPSARVT